MKLSGKAIVAGVAGWPVSHSLSPLLHNTLIAENGIDGLYVPLAIRREELATALAGLRAAGFRGLNLTVPHKEAGFALAHCADEAARACGAANLLLFHDDGTIEARNTDATGLMEHLRQSGVTLAGQSAVIAGAGGAARAAVLALDGLGANEIRLINRNKARAAALAASLGAHVKARLTVFSWEDWGKAAGDVALFVNTTVAGMKGQPPLTLGVDLLPEQAAVCDVIYNPLETELLKQARARGHHVIDGLGMLLYQAVPTFAAFYGMTPKLTAALRQTLEKALAGG